MSTTARILSEDAPLDLRFSDPELETVRENLVSFIETTVEDADADGATLGLSGGIDSTTTAYLAVEALGTDGLHGLVMPSEVNDASNMSDAERVAEELGIEYDVIEIQPIAWRWATSTSGREPWSTTSSPTPRTGSSSGPATAPRR